MNSVFVVAVLLSICAVVSCYYDYPNISLDALKELSDDARNRLEVKISNLTEAIEDKWDTVHDLMGEMDADENSTEPEGIDADGCDRKLRKHFEDRCDDEYEKVNDEAQQIEDENEKIEAVCCALEDFEKCSLRAYDQANCVKNKVAIRENLKAARLFLSVVANITCTEFRGRCAYYSSSAATGYSVTTVTEYVILLTSLLSSLAVIMV